MKSNYERLRDMKAADIWDYITFNGPYQSVEGMVKNARYLIDNYPHHTQTVCDVMANKDISKHDAAYFLAVNQELIRRRKG